MTIGFGKLRLTNSDPLGSLASQSLAVGVGLLISRGLGFIRDVIIAYQFGASAHTDAYLIAAQVPFVFDSLLAGGGLYSALMPVAALCVAHDRSDKSLGRLIGNTTTFVLLVSGSAGLLGLLFSPLIVKVFGGGLDSDASSIATHLVSMTMLGLPFIGLTNVAWAALNTKERFWGPAFAQSSSNFVLIAFAIAFGPTFGIYALGIGYIIGVILQVVPQYLELGYIRIPFRLGLDLRDPDLLAVFHLFWPLAIGSLVLILSAAVDNYFSTLLPPGGVTIIRYAWGLTVPFSIISMGISIPALTRLSRDVVKSDFVHMSAFLQQVVRVLSLVLFGAAAYLVGVREPIVSLVYQRGAFDYVAAQRTSETLAVYAFWLPFGGVYYFLLRGLIAFSKSRLILLLNGLALILNFALDLIFFTPLAHAGIALSSVFVQIVFVFLSALILERELKHKHFSAKMLFPLCANGVAAVLGIGGGLWGGLTLRQFTSSESWLYWICVSCIVAFLYLAVSKVLGVCDFSWLRLLTPSRRIAQDIESG